MGDKSAIVSDRSSFLHFAYIFKRFEKVHNRVEIDIRFCRNKQKPLRKKAGSLFSTSPSLSLLFVWNRLRFRFRVVAAASALPDIQAQGDPSGWLKSPDDLVPTRYYSYLLPRQDGGTSQIQVNGMFLPSWWVTLWQREKKKEEGGLNKRPHGTISKQPCWCRCLPKVPDRQGA